MRPDAPARGCQSVPTDRYRPPSPPASARVVVARKRKSVEPATGQALADDLAFASCLYDFEHPSTMGPMQQKAGARMFYVPSVPWTIMLPVSHILLSFVQGAAYEAILEGINAANQSTLASRR